METYPLISHPDHPALAVTRVEARIIGIDDEWIRFRWRIEGCGSLVVPPFAGKGRADELWQTTCFEVFIRPEADSAHYIELNLSPSERWNAYAFSRYREDMAEHSMPREPSCTMRVGQSMAIFDAAVPRAGLPPLPWQFGMSAVIEEEGGTKSYWAIAHPEGKPDFHHPACFAATLPAPAAS